MMCDHCAQPIAQGEEYDRYPVDSLSGAVPDVILHREPCTAPPAPTGPGARLAPFRSRSR